MNKYFFLSFFLGSFLIFSPVFATNTVAPLTGDVTTVLEFGTFDSPADVVCVFAPVSQEKIGCVDPFDFENNDGIIPWDHLYNVFSVQNSSFNSPGTYYFTWQNSQSQNYSLLVSYSDFINDDGFVSESDFNLTVNPLIPQVLSNGMHTETYASILFVISCATGLYFMVSLFRGFFRPKRR